MVKKERVFSWVQKRNNMKNFNLLIRKILNDIEEPLLFREQEVSRNEKSGLQKDLTYLPVDYVTTMSPL